MVPLSNRTLALVGSAAMLGLCAFQFGDRNGLNNMSYAQVQPLVADLAKAERMARDGNLELLAGQTVKGNAVRLRGELTDANCYFNSHTHAYDHAFCAKFCAAAGSPLIFLSDQNGQIYFVLSPRNGVRLSNAVLDQIGIPGIVVSGRSLEASGISTLALETVGQQSK